ncbi:MAG: hypothetical protein IT158_25270 [Bryobacterales bacterium]|nr:hypothetical protein [Bryobacterales bacterium]
MHLRGIWVLPLAAIFAFAVTRLTPGSSLCEACRRDVHHNSRTVAAIDGRSQTFCCPSCALAKGRQRGVPVRFLEMTDFDSGLPLPPARAFLVRGSDLATCRNEHTPVDETGHKPALVYDRCSPSLPAFSTKERAEGFVRSHGGAIFRLESSQPAL